MIVRSVALRLMLRPREQVQRQLQLGERERGWSEADRAVDRAALRFGRGAVRPATLLAPRFSGSA
jgi:DNA polymerase-4